MRKQKSYKELETESTRGKLRYLKRVAADFESEAELKEWLENNQDQQEEETKEDNNVRPFG